MYRVAKLQPFLQKLVGTATLALLAGAPLPAATAASPGSDPAAAGHGQSSFEPIALYGTEIRFAVLRNGDPVGSHSVSFAPDGEDLVVRTHFQVEVRFLLFTAYRYTYKAEDQWRRGTLLSLQAETDDNGKRHRVEARAAGDELRIRGPDGPAVGQKGIFPTHHWHPGVLTADRVLNTITGRINRIGILDLGKEWIAAGNTRIQARRYAYTGELDNEVWYDPEGRWVKMRFRAEDGSTIDYVCEKCGVAAGGQS